MPLRSRAKHAIDSKSFELLSKANGSSGGTELVNDHLKRTSTDYQLMPLRSRAKYVIDSKSFKLLSKASLSLEQVPDLIIKNVPPTYYQLFTPK